ncbi:MAG: diguanylate cyclase [Fidelibacterota bacterium]
MFPLNKISISPLRFFRPSVILPLVFIISFLILVYPGIGDIRYALILKAGIFTLLLISILITVISLRVGRGEVAVNGKAKRFEEGEKPVDLTILGEERRVDPETEYKNFIGEILGIIRSTLVGTTSGFYLLSKARKQMILQDFSSEMEDISLKKNLEMGNGILGEVFDRKEPLLMSGSADVELSTNYYEKQQEIRSFMGSPVGYDDRIIGILFVDSKIEGAFGEDDVSLLKSYADLISRSIFQYDTIYNLDSKFKLYSILYQTNTDIHQMWRKADLLDEITALTRRLFSFDRLTISLLDDQDDTKAVIEKVYGLEDAFKEGFEYNITEGFNGLVIRTGESVFISNIEKEGYFKPRFVKDEKTNYDLRSFLGVPVGGKERFLGVISIESKLPGAFTEKDRKVLEMIGLNLGSALIKLHVHKTMLQMATTDELTGISNYRSFKDRLTHEIYRAKRYDQNISLLILDIDKFKNVNDRYGHLAGDFVLREIAQTIKASIRQIDSVARYGGEEFAIILVKSAKEDSIKTAERIRKSIDSKIFERDSSRISVKVSIGVAEYPEDAKTEDDLIACADKAMYSAKAEGGNKVKGYGI